MSDIDDGDDYIISNFCHYCRKKVDNIDNHRKTYHERNENEGEESEEEKEKIIYTSWVTKKCHLHSNIKISYSEIRNCGLCKIFPTRKIK